MTIRSVNNLDKLYGASSKENVKDKVKEEEKATDAAAAKQSGDKLELSAEAQKLQPIKQKVAEGFYDNPDVIREAARKMNQEFNK